MKREQYYGQLRWRFYKQEPGSDGEERPPELPDIKSRKFSYPAVCMESSMGIIVHRARGLTPLNEKIGAKEKSKVERLGRDLRLPPWVREQGPDVGGRLPARSSLQWRST